MFKIIDKSTNEEKILYEVCDKDYYISLNELRMRGIDNKEVIKNSILKTYADVITSPKEVDYYLPTGIEDLDNSIGGGLSSGLYVIGANPGLGKTSLVLNILQNLALNQHYSLLFNLEMSVFQITTKLLSNFSYRKSLLDNKFPKKTINELSSKKLYNSDTQKIDDGLKLIYDSYRCIIGPFINVITYNEDNDYRYVEFIETALKNYEEYHQIKPVVVVDFLQLLQLRPIYDENNTISDKPVDKRMEMDKIIEKLKKYSNCYKVPIILISSLSRSSYTKEETGDYEIEYSLSIFKETGHIEYTADFLALLTKGESKTRFGEEDQTIININILKNRYGKAGIKVPLSFISEYSYFESVANKD
ncbi:MAG: DnaB-like helicase C-terminal domain-containing protein [Bacilli bacterium]|nr:DnaB-like helicase C-terminal domain-containing protein [Bacilli bacterium]